VKQELGFKLAKGHIHLEISGLLGPYIQGDLSQEETRMLENHVPECDECQKKLGLAMLIAVEGLPGWKRLGDMGPKAPPRNVVPFLG
jgi:hypothetical protein